MANKDLNFLAVSGDGDTETSRFRLILTGMLLPAFSSVEFRV